MAQVLISIREIQVGDICEISFVAPMTAPHYGKSVETVTVQTVDHGACEGEGLFANLGMKSIAINGRDILDHSGLFIAERP